MFGGVALLGMAGAEEVATGPDLGDCFYGQGGVIDGDGFEHFGNHVEDVAVDNHFFVGG